MNIQDAAHRIGHEYPGGAVALAHRMGINPTVFNSKLNPNNATHHLTLAEAQRMQQLTGRTDILEAMASGLPLALTGQALQAWLTTEGVDSLTRIPGIGKKRAIALLNWSRVP